MKKIILAGFFVLALAACNIGGIRGNGHIVTESRNVSSPFSNVVISGAFEVEWRSGSPSVSVSADENLMPFVEAAAGDGTLRVHTSRDVRPSHPIKLAITSALLESASLNGASRFNGHQLGGARF